MRKLSVAGRVFAVIVAVTLALSGNIAVAASFDVGSKITLDAPGRVHRHRLFTLSGHVTSRKRFCERNRTVELLRDGIVVDTTTTNSKGAYHFDQRITRKTVFQTRVLEKTDGTHPDIRHCKSAESKRVTVRIKRRH